MAIFDEITGIGVASGFKLQAQVPLDVRTVVDSTDDLSALIEENGAYEGMVVYVKSEDALYALKGTSADDWIKIMDALQTEFTEKLTLSVVDALPESSVSYDFEDGVSLFTTPSISSSSKGTASVAEDETTGNHYQSIKVSDSATIGSSSNVLSKLDFSDTTENATDMTVEFDFQFANVGRMRIALCDLDVQDAKTGNFRYDFDGFAVDIWSKGSNVFQINNSGSSHSSFFGAWLHARFDIDFTTNKVTYKIVNNSDASDYLSGTKDFHGGCTKVTGIIVYTWNPGDEMYIDNIEITARMEATENVLYGIENDGDLDVYAYVDGKAMLISSADSGAELAAGSVTTVKLANSAVTEAKIQDGAVSVDKLADELKTYSATPQKVGYWIDGTPIWRVAFDSVELTETTYSAYTLPYVYTSAVIIPATNYDEVHLINSAVSLGGNDMVDCPLLCGDGMLMNSESGTITLVWKIGTNGSGRFSVATTSEESSPIISGFIEFATPESNITT